MITEERKRFIRPVQQGLIIVFSALSIMAMLLAAYYARWILLTTMIGVGSGVLIVPLMRYLHDRARLPKGVVAVGLFFLFTGVMLGLTYAVYSIISTQLVPLIDQAPELVETVHKRASGILRRHPWVESQVGGFKAGAYVKNAAGTVMKGLQLGVAAIAGFFLILTIALYLATNPRRYMEGLLSLFPAHMRPRTREVLGRSATMMRKWFGSQLIAMSAVGALTAVGLLAIGIDYWPLFGLLTGALDLIPYIGPFLAFASILLVTLASEPDKAIWVVGTFLAVQQIEANLIVPLVMKHQIELPPIQLMTMMFVLGSWFGLLGVLVAPPLLAVGRTIYLMTWVQRMNQLTEPPTPTPKPQIEIPPEAQAKEEKRSA